jgi:hypothetical protein
MLGMSNHDHLSNIGLHPAYDPDPAVRNPVIVDALLRRISDAQHAVEVIQGLQGSTVSVTIGRNIGGSDAVPMADHLWQEFRALTGSTLANLLAPDFSASYDGVGEWDGAPEESTLFVASGVTSTTTSETLRLVLETLARKFGQDAIALTVGTTELVAS